MEHEIERWIEADRKELESQLGLDPCFPDRMKARLRSPAPRRSQRRRVHQRLLAVVSIYAFILLFLTIAHLRWIDRLEQSRRQPVEVSQLSLNPFPSEAQPAFTQSFLEVAQWQK